MKTQCYTRKSLMDKVSPSGGRAVKFFLLFYSRRLALRQPKGEYRLVEKSVHTHHKHSVGMQPYLNIEGCIPTECSIYDVLLILPRVNPYGITELNSRAPKEEIASLLIQNLILLK